MARWKKIDAILLAVSCMTVAMNAYAYNEDDGEGYIPGSDLRGYEPSYLVYAFDDDDHLEFKISIKYPLLESSFGTVGDFFGGENQIYFSYTGKYDFFLFSDDPARDSAPVISRVQNPGLFITNKRPDFNGEGLEMVSVGWFHESNGQQIGDNTTFMNTANAADFVSRGWDYLGVDFRFRSKSPWFFDGDVVYDLRTRLFCDCQGFGFIDDREDDITIFGGTQTARIEDFDGLRFTINNYANRWLHYGLQLRTGTADTDALENLSYMFQISWRIGNVPVRLFYFNGYGKDISTYHIKDEYAGFGFEFW